MKWETLPGGRVKKIAIAVIGLTFGVALMLLGSFGGSSAGEEAQGEPGDAASYRREVETRIRDLCALVRGAGEVEVYVTLGGGYEYVYSLDDGGECVTVGNGSSERAVVRLVKSPEIVGVGIVCRGARDIAVKQALCELVCTALDIGSNRVMVVEGQ